MNEFVGVGEEARATKLGSTRARRLGLARDVGLVLLTKALVSTIVLSTGFTAVSDDDYARVTIAQRFVEAPSLDPSGSSWLPLPFWLYGSFLALFGKSLEVARACAFLSSALSLVLVWHVARCLGAPRKAAIAAAIVAGAFPSAARLGVATVPEAWTAAFVLFGVASLAMRSEARVWGGLALALASASRYEAWPVALGFALISAWDVFKRNGPRTYGVVGALLSVSFIPCWLAHGALSHGDPLFFVERVSEYRRAMTGEDVPNFSAALAYPVKLLTCEPELMLLSGLALTLARRRGLLAAFSKYRRPLLLLGLLLASLMLSALRGGAPTHHFERTLLPVWLLFSVLSMHALFVLRSHAPAPALWAAAKVPLGVTLVAALVIRFLPFGRESFVDRQAEETAGREARLLLARAARDRTLAIATSDYGYFAITAAFGSPSRVRYLSDHHPQHAAENRPLDEAALRRRLGEEKAAVLVVDGEYRALSLRIGPERARFGRLSVLEL